MDHPLYTGLVQKKLMCQGSKSERCAVVLTTDDGEFILRRSGGNPFNDEVLNALVGQTITVEGEIRCNVLFMI
jgi:hypothetical protein